MNHGILSQRARYFVINENTLCYQQVGSQLFGTLGRNAHGRDPMSGPFYAGSADKVRPATEQDFDTFRVHIGGHDSDLRLQHEELAAAQ